MLWLSLCPLNRYSVSISGQADMASFANEALIHTCEVTVKKFKKSLKCPNPKTTKLGLN